MLVKRRSPQIEPKQPLPTLTANELANRLLAYIDARRLRRGQTPNKAINLRQIARNSGLGYEAVVSYVLRRRTKLSLDAFDSMLYALGLSILDLLRPNEIELTAPKPKPQKISVDNGSDSV